MLLVTPRNSIPAYTNLFKITGCEVMIAAEPRLSAVDEILAVHRIRVIRAPSIEELLTTRYHHYAFAKTFDEARDEPLVVMHTSGTTALPKPIVYTHDYAACCNRITQLDPPAGFKSIEKMFQANRLFVMTPPFHVGPHESLCNSLTLNCWRIRRQQTFSIHSYVLYPIKPSSYSPCRALRPRLKFWLMGWNTQVLMLPLLLQPW